MSHTPSFDSEIRGKNSYKGECGEFLVSTWASRSFPCVHGALRAERYPSPSLPIRVKDESLKNPQQDDTTNSCSVSPVTESDDFSTPDECAAVEPQSRVQKFIERATEKTLQKEIKKKFSVGKCSKKSTILLRVF